MQFLRLDNRNSMFIGKCNILDDVKADSLDYLYEPKEDQFTFHRILKLLFIDEGFGRLFKRCKTIV